MFSKLNNKKSISKSKYPSKKTGEFKHTFRVIPANEINEHRSQAYTYLV